MIKLSVIIPARGEFPNVVHTFHSILHCWEADGFDPKEIEIIIVDNASTDSKTDKPADKGTSTYLMPRGGYFNRVLRVLYDPICGNHSARTKGAKIARGEYLFFSDAHMAYRPGFFKSILKTVDESGGLVHGTIAWMGAYPPEPSGLGYGYTIKLGEEWKGTWNNYRLADKWFYVPAQGHCSVAVKRDQFMKFGGYQEIHRTYGGGEMYLDMKWWMFGSTVAVDPNAVGYHLASSRGYAYMHDDYIENVLGCSYALGCDDWRERTYINLLRKSRKEVLDKMMERSEREHAPNRKFVERHRKSTFNEILVDRPWERLNKKRLDGVGQSNLLIYQDTILPLFKANPVAWKAYEESKFQKDLEKFINENLSEFVYKRTAKTQEENV